MGVVSVVTAWVWRVKLRAWWRTLGTGVCRHAVAIGAISEALNARWRVENPTHPERAQVVRRLALGDRSDDADTGRRVAPRGFHAVTHFEGYQTRERGRCRIDACRGRATERDDLCMFHAYRPTPAPPRPPAPRVGYQTVEEVLRVECPERVCPECGKLCASALGVEFHVELKHAKNADPNTRSGIMGDAKSGARDADTSGHRDRHLTERHR